MNMIEKTIELDSKNNKHYFEYDVSIIVATYNSRWEAEVATLDSILKQKDIDFEVIVTDDGSQDNHFNLLEKYFEEKGFTDFKLINNSVNRGTVNNAYSGLVKAKGKYIKNIGPGDMIYKNDTLAKWIEFMECNNLEWSFSNVISYENVAGEIIPISVNAHPHNIQVYKKGTDEDIRWQYVVLFDTAVGASMMCLRDLQIKYLEEILGKVIYAEDNIWRLMMFDGVVGKFYDDYTILYEYGTGISTSKNNIWYMRILDDRKNTNKIISNRKELDDFQIKMWKAYNTKGKLNKLLIKGKLIDKLFYNKKKSINYMP